MPALDERANNVSGLDRTRETDVPEASREEDRGEATGDAPESESQIKQEKLFLERDKIVSEIKKLALECEKLSFERRSIKRQLSWYGEIREWLKAAAVPIALVGVAATFNVGMQQVAEVRENRATDRLDKALTRLASSGVNERVTGAAGLRQFLFEPNEARKKSALYYLVNAIASETDPTVQGTFLDILREQKPSSLTNDARDEALAAVLAKNRALTRFILAGHSNTNFGLDEKHSDPFKELSNTDLLRLQGMVAAINVLIEQGGRTDDFREIFCDGCDFRPAGNLSKARFDRSYLSAAQFSRMNLAEASFRDVDLSRADFSDANLTRASLSSSNRQLFRGALPIFRCANLAGADLSGAIMVNIVATRRSRALEKDDVRVSAPNFVFANFDENTHIDNIGIVVKEGIESSREQSGLSDVHYSVIFFPLGWHQDRLGHGTFAEAPNWLVPSILQTLHHPNFQKIPVVARSVPTYSGFTPILKELSAKKDDISDCNNPQKLNSLLDLYGFELRRTASSK